ncbi:MAG TPA: HisA/HisF-related TIM barrel protein [Bryobacteraceae bacterium]|nr:HisA/HisF-related TIM barrel protein [Bryobacteraceae bacterium]
MDGKVVQLVQGREKALEGGSMEETLARFAAFPQIQVIDLDVAMGRGSNESLVRLAASRTLARVGGGVRTVERALELAGLGVHRVIVGTAAFDVGQQGGGINHTFLEALASAVGRQCLVIAVDSRDGRIVVKGWRESTALAAEDVVRELEPYCSGFLCTYVDKEGMLQGTDLEWFRRLRAATQLELTAAGGLTTMDDVRALLAMGIHAALGMAIYTGRLPLEELARLVREGA